MHRKTSLKLTELNPLLTCSLCTGYLIDATTLTECLHSFCRSCLVRYLHTSQQCPKCDTLVHKTRPLLNASSSQSARSPGNLGVDRALQNIVYKLVPGLFKDEMKKRRDFYTKNPQASTSSQSTSPGDLEARGEVSEEALVIYSDDEHMNLSLEYYVPYRRKILEGKKQSETEKSKKRSNDDSMEDDEIVHKRYLRCPAAVCVKHIKKFIRNKFDLKPTYEIEITHLDNEDDSLPDDYTLMDVAYIYTWRRNGPLPLVFRVFEEANKRLKTKHLTDPVPANIQPASDDTSKPASNSQPPSLCPEPVSKDSTQSTTNEEGLKAVSSVETGKTLAEETVKAAPSKSLDSEKEKDITGESNQTRDGDTKTTEPESLPDLIRVDNGDTVVTSVKHRNDIEKGLEGCNDLEKDEISVPSLNNNDKRQDVIKHDRPKMNGSIAIHLQKADVTSLSSLDTQTTLTTAPVSVR